MKWIVTKTTLSLVLVIFLCSCSSYVRVKETWKTPEGVSTGYKKILVAGITPRPNLRHSFENIFVETLEKHGVDAVASYTLITDLNKADEAQFEAVARQVGADAVVITRVLSHSEHTSYKLSTGHVEYRTVAATTTTAHSSTTVAMSGVGIVAGEMDSEGATLQTNFFDASSGKRVWSAMSSAAGANNEKISVCWDLSALLVKALGDDQVI